MGGTILGLIIAQSSLMQLSWVSAHNFSKCPCHWWSSQLRSFTVPKPIGIDPEHERMKLWKCPQYYVERGCRRTGYVVPAVGWFYRLIDFKEQNIFMPLYDWPTCTTFFSMQPVHGPNISTKFHQNRSTNLGELAHVSLHGFKRWTPSPRVAALDRPETGYLSAERLGQAVFRVEFSANRSYGGARQRMRVNDTGS